VARSRNIKPGFFLNDELAQLDMAARLLFAGLWCIADREGRLQDRPMRIKAEVLPYDDCDVDSLLNQLHDAGFVTRYEIDGYKYIQVNNFSKHQNPHKNEAESVIPPPEEVVLEQYSTSTVQAPYKHSTNPADSLNMIPDSLNSDHDNLKTDRAAQFDPAQIEADGRRRDVLKKFEEAWGRTLTVAEVTMIEHRVDKHGSELVLHALEISVLNQVLKIRYLDGILDSWDKANLKTVQQVQEHEKQRKEKKERASPGKKCSTTGEQYELYISPARLEALKVDSG
jgi:DnaD/phage-associated family protein